MAVSRLPKTYLKRFSWPHSVLRKGAMIKKNKGSYFLSSVAQRWLLVDQKPYLVENTRTLCKKATVGINFQVVDMKDLDL